MFIIVAVLVRSSWEQKHFITRNYTLQAEGLKESFKVAVIADLHGAVYGKENEELIRAIDKAAPDMILIPGDLITCRRGTDVAETPDLLLLRALASRYPVYYAPGNHEENYLMLHQEYAREVADTGAVFLLNDIAEADWSGDTVGRTGVKTSVGDLSGSAGKASVGDLSGSGVKTSVGDPFPSADGVSAGRTSGNRPMKSRSDRVFIAGLAIGEDYYVRGRQPQMPADFVEDRLGTCPDGFTILLAHNPGFFKTYAQWGCDMVFSGHNHGGVVRLPLLGGVISASLHLFDRYDRGVFREGKTTMVLSAGLGMHTIHLRLFNRPELVVVSIQGARSEP